MYMTSFLAAWGFEIYIKPKIIEFNFLVTVQALTKYLHVKITVVYFDYILHHVCVIIQKN